MLNIVDVKAAVEFLLNEICFEIHLLHLYEHDDVKSRMKLMVILYVTQSNTKKPKVIQSNPK